MTTAEFLSNKYPILGTHHMENRIHRKQHDLQNIENVLIIYQTQIIHCSARLKISKGQLYEYAEQEMRTELV